MSALRILYTTWPDTESARRAAHTLVGEQLVACANLIPGMESIYRWQGEVESATEVILLLKTVVQRVPDVIRRVTELHTYSVPCVVELTPGAVAPAYLAWAVESVPID